MTKAQLNEPKLTRNGSKVRILLDLGKSSNKLRHLLKPIIKP